MKHFLCVLTLIVVGCAAPPFTPYVGQQQAWPTAPGAFVATVDGIHIYPRGSLPSRPYRMIAAVTADSPQQLTAAAKAHLADAALIQDEQLVDRGTVGDEQLSAQNPISISALSAPLREE